MRDFLIDYPVNDFFLVILVFFISIITTIGGVGGGGLLIPVYMLVGKFNLYESIPITIFTILGDTCVRVFFLYNKKHPLNNKRDIIYFPPLLLISLFDANSSFFGVILSNFTPACVTISCLILILLITFYKTIKKAIDTYQEELVYLKDPYMGLRLIMIDGIGKYFRIEDLENKEDFFIDQEKILLSSDNNTSSKNNKIIIFDGIEGRIEYGDKKKEKYFNTFLLFSNICTISIFSITRKFFQVCNYLYWIHSLGQFFICFLLGSYNIKYILEDYKFKKNNNYQFVKGDIQWNMKVIKKFILIGTLTGFISTYIGIGGGMLTTPIMIHVGMIPEIVTSTSSISTLCSCIISCLNYLIAGELNYIYGGIMAIVSGLGSILGLYLSDFILHKYKKQSPIIFIVSIILFFSIILLSVNAFSSQLIYDYNFKPLCKYT